MLRLRLLQLLLLILAAVGGVKAWNKYAYPPRQTLKDLADQPLQQIFGPRVTYDWPFRIDFTSGVQIENLRVPSTGGFLPKAAGQETGKTLPGFQADRVVIHHDPMALLAGRYRPVRLEMDGARVVTHETESGISLDFPLDFSRDDERGEDAFPAVILRDVEVLYRARKGSTRLREGSVVRVIVEELSLLPHKDGTIEVSGEARTLKLGQDDARITVSGNITSDGREFDLVARWDPLRLTAELLGLPATAETPASAGLLAEPLAAKLRQRSIRSGTFTLKLSRHGTQVEGEVGVGVEWDSEVEISLTDMPGLETVDARTKQQITELFGRGALDAAMGEGRIDIKSLVTELAGGQVHATGWIMRETGEFRIDFKLQNLQLEDPAIRRALGEDNASLFEEFDPHGLVDAVGHVTSNAKGKVEWVVDVLLEDARLTYVGSPGPDGKRVGFPYTISHTTGHLTIDSNGVTFGDIIGSHRSAEVRILGHQEKAWTGGETGRIRFTDDGPEVRITIVANDVPYDDEIREAIAQSEFADTFEDFNLEGVVDKIELDILRFPEIEEVAQTELRITLEGEQFSYKPFPLPMEDVRGQITMLRPVLDKERGRIYAFDVTGWAEGAPLHVVAKIVEHEGRGRLRISAEGLPLAGTVSETMLTAEVTAEALGDVWRWLAPRGKADVLVDIPVAGDPDPLHVNAKFKGASIRLAAEGKAPLEIADLTGQLDVLGKVVTLTDLRGTVGGSAVQVEGRMGGGISGTWDLKAHIERLRLTPVLQRSLASLNPDGHLLPGGMHFESGSRLSLELDLDKAAGEDTPIQIAFRATELDTVVRMPDGTHLGLAGKLIEVSGEEVRARDMRIETEGLTVAIHEAQLHLGDETDVTGHFEVVMDDFVITQGVLHLLPEGAAELARTWTTDRVLNTRGLRIHAPEVGPVTLEGELRFEVPADGPVGEGPRGQIELAPFVIGSEGDDTPALRGVVRLRGFSMDVGVDLQDLDGTIEVDYLRLGAHPEGRGRVAQASGRILGLSVSKLSFPVTWTKDVLRIPTVTGRIVGGALTARFMMHTAEPTSYEGAATVKDFDVARLRDDLAPTGASYTGVGQAHVTFQNRGGKLHDLTAAGSVHIRKGNLGDLPFVANIFVLVDELVDAEDRPQFERADVDFVLQREVFRFSRLDLAGPLFELPGRGTLDLGGVVDLRFTPDLIKGLILPGVMQVPGLGDLLRGVLREELIYAIRLRGDLETAEPEVVFLPPLGLGEGRRFEGTGARKLPGRQLPGWFR